MYSSPFNIQYSYYSKLFNVKYFYYNKLHNFHYIYYSNPFSVDYFLHRSPSAFSSFSIINSSTFSTVTILIYLINSFSLWSISQPLLSTIRLLAASFKLIIIQSSELHNQKAFALNYPSQLNSPSPLVSQ